MMGNYMAGVMDSLEAEKKVVLKVSVMAVPREVSKGYCWVEPTEY